MKGNEDNIYISIYNGKIIFGFFSPAYNRCVCGEGGGGSILGFYNKTIYLDLKLATNHNFLFLSGLFVYFRF